MASASPARGIGLTNKLRAYGLQEQGATRWTQNLALGSATTNETTACRRHDAAGQTMFALEHAASGSCGSNIMF